MVQNIRSLIDSLCRSSSNIPMFYPSDLWQHSPILYLMYELLQTSLKLTLHFPNSFAFSECLCSTSDSFGHRPLCLWILGHSARPFMCSCTLMAMTHVCRDISALRLGVRGYEVFSEIPRYCNKGQFHSDIIYYIVPHLVVLLISLPYLLGHF
jgi:hypothetical protein